MQIAARIRILIVVNVFDKFIVKLIMMLSFVFAGWQLAISFSR